MQNFRSGNPNWKLTLNDVNMDEIAPTMSFCKFVISQ